MQLEILIIENNPSDARLTLEAFKEVGLRDGLRCMPDGDEALKYLQNAAKGSIADLPHMIFLDLDLPKKPGIQVLAEIKSNRTLTMIPVVVVSGCNNPAQIREVYELHASCFIYKPSDLHQFLYFIRTCYEFWGKVVTLPPRPDPQTAKA